MKWIRQRLIAGFFITVPLAVSAFTFVWLFRLVAALTQGLFARYLDPFVPATYIPWLGILFTVLFVLLMGILATNVFGRRLLRQTEALLLHIPVFRTIYAPVKQLTVAFSPDNEFGFKRVVLVEHGTRGWVLGFLTREFIADRGQGRERLFSVYVPTNHLYLGDILICRPEQTTFPEMTVEQGLRVFLTGGMALPGELRTGPPPASLKS